MSYLIEINTFIQLLFSEYNAVSLFTFFIEYKHQYYHHSLLSFSIVSMCQVLVVSSVRYALIVTRSHSGLVVKSMNKRICINVFTRGVDGCSFGEAGLEGE